MSAEGHRFNSESLVDESPTFLAFTATKGDHGAEALVLHNGQAGTPEAFSPRRRWSMARSGHLAQGLWVSLTYSQDSNDFEVAATVYSTSTRRHRRPHRALRGRRSRRRMDTTPIPTRYA